MAMKYVFALDQGIPSSLAILFGKEGSIHGIAQHEFKQIYPDVSMAKHNPHDILTSQLISAVN